MKGFEAVALHGCTSGLIPVPVIGDNGNWFIGNDDTGVKAGTTSDLGQRLADLETKYEQLNSDIVLWKNPNSAVSFAGQDIVLSTGDYNQITVYYRTTTAVADIKSVSAQKGENVLCDAAVGGPSGVQSLTRSVRYVSDTVYRVTGGTLYDAGSQSANNAYCIPLRITGRK